MDRQELFSRYTDLVLRHERMIRALCLRRSDDDDEMKDLAQEVRIGLWQRFAAAGGNIGAWPEGLWVFWYTRSIVSHRHRHPRSELVMLDRHMVEDIAEEDDAADRLVDELSEGLPADLAKLLEQLRMGYSVAEIAELGGTPIETVKSRRRRLVEHMRRRAEERGMIEPDKEPFNQNTNAL